MLVQARIGQVRSFLHPRVHVCATRRELLHEVEAAQVSRSFGSGIVVSDARLPHRSQRMKDGVAGEVRVRIGAGVQQVSRQLEMRVHHRHEQRTRARGRHAPAVSTAPSVQRHSLVDVCPRLQQHLDDVDAPFSNGEQHRRETGGQASAEIGAGCDEDFRHAGMAFRGRPHQRRLTAPIVFAVDVGTAGEQCFHRGQGTDARGGHQGRLSARQSRVRVRAGLEEQLDNRRVAVRAGQRQRRHAIPVRRFHVRTGTHQQLRRLQIVLIRRPVEGRHSVDLRSVHIDVLVQERADLCAVHLFSGVRQERVRRRRRAG